MGACGRAMLLLVVVDTMIPTRSISTMTSAISSDSYPENYVPTSKSNKLIFHSVYFGGKFSTPEIQLLQLTGTILGKGYKGPE